MEYIFDYLSFLAKTGTVTIAVIAILSVVAAASMRRSLRDHGGRLEVTRVNDRLRDMSFALQQAVSTTANLKKLTKEEKRNRKRESKAESDRERIFVVNFEGDIQASNVNRLRNEITAILSIMRETDEVVVKLDSAGGMVHGYGLAASQLARVKASGVRLVATIDKVAASGGYLMAAVADRVLAAPFALVGSIGVVAQIPNVHRLLKKYDVDFDVLTAGEHKRTLTVFGENTEKDREKFIEELEDLHSLFKEFVADNRPDLDLASVATGEAWYGRRAIEHKLIDELSTSDEYLMSACDEKDVFEVKWIEVKKPIERLLGKISGAASELIDRVWGRVK